MIFLSSVSYIRAFICRYISVSRRNWLRFFLSPLNGVGGLSLISFASGAGAGAAAPVVDDWVAISEVVGGRGTEKGIGTCRGVVGQDGLSGERVASCSVRSSISICLGYSDRNCLLFCLS
jgi:hypothetical protein